MVGGNDELINRDEEARTGDQESLRPLSNFPKLFLPLLLVPGGPNPTGLKSTPNE